MIADIENGKRERSAGHPCDLDFTAGSGARGLGALGRGA